MKVGVFANTPAQINFYKNIIEILSSRGNKIYFLTRNYGETIDLANELELDYYVYSSSAKFKYRKMLSLPLDILNAYRYLKNLNVDMVTGFGLYDAFTSSLLRVPAIIFNDSEPFVNMMTYNILYKLYMPFVDVHISPDCFRQDFGDKLLRVASYKEMAYLHSKYYKPDEDIFDLLGISRNETYALLRFNSFDALHDISIRGFDESDKIDLVKKLEDSAHVFISSEKDVPLSLQKNVLSIPKKRIHDAIFYAKLLVTDTQTMTTEAALLGTPVVRCNSFVGVNDMGNFIELEKRYGLIYNYKDPKNAISKAEELIKNTDLKKKWQNKRKNLFRDKINIAEFMVWFLENYPNSLKLFNDDPSIQYRITL